MVNSFTLPVKINFVQPSLQLNRYIKLTVDQIPSEFVECHFNNLLNAFKTQYRLRITNKLHVTWKILPNCILNSVFPESLLCDNSQNTIKLVLTHVKVWIKFVSKNNFSCKRVLDSPILIFKWFPESISLWFSLSYSAHTQQQQVINIHFWKLSPRLEHAACNVCLAPLYTECYGLSLLKFYCYQYSYRSWCGQLLVQNCSQNSLTI